MPLEIPVFRPLLEDDELRAAEQALRMGWLGMGRFVGEFEEALQHLIGAPDRFVVALSTGHAALHLALLRMGIGPGDEVITPAFNNIADFQAIRATGADPVFCDIDSMTLCINPSAAEAMIGPKTRAIIVTDYACHLADHDALGALASRHGLRLLHDAAHSIGSVYNGRNIGSFSDFTMFSFDPVKTITTIDGGAMVVRSLDDVTWFHEARLIGMGQPTEVMYENRRAWTYDVKHIGFRYHMANLHAALGLAQIAKFERIAISRRATAQRFSREMFGIDGLVLPQTDFCNIVPFMYYVRVEPERRNNFIAHLKEYGVDTGLHWQPGNRFAYFCDCRRDALTVTERVASEIVTIPFHSAMSEHDEARVIEAVTGFFRKAVHNG